MAKFAGKIGFAVQAEVSGSPDVWENTIVEKDYVGDVIKNSRKYENSSNVNANLGLNVQISIIGNSYARTNLGNIRYVKFEGNTWCVTNIDMVFPRLILTLGGLYNGQ